jgi:hypothetical protein
MARADLLIDTVRTGAEGNQELFRRALGDWICEERSTAPRHLYPRPTSFASLQAAAGRAQRGKWYRPAVLAFNANLEAELLALQEELRGFSYRPGPYRQFRIRDPKPRLISAAPYRDRVVLQADIRLYFPSIDFTILRAQLAAARAADRQPHQPVSGQSAPQRPRPLPQRPARGAGLSALCG